MDPFDINQESAFEGGLRWLSRPRNVVQNIAKGNIGGAIRQFGDIVLDPIDAILPGDVIPALSRADDYSNASDFVGGMEPGLGKTAVDVLGNTLTDPLTYVGLAPFAKAAGALRGAAGTVPALERALTEAETVGKGALFQLKRATGNLTPSQQNAALAASGAAKGATTSQAATGYAVETFKGVDPTTQRRAIETIRGVSSEIPGATGYVDVDALAGLAAKTTKYGTMDEQLARINARLDRMNWTPAEKEAVRDVATKAVDFTRNQWKQGVRDKVFHLPKGVNPEAAPLDYLPGVYEMETAATPNIIGAKEIRSSASLADWLNKEKAALDTDLPVLLGDYGTRIGQAVKSAEIGRGLAPTEFQALAHEESRTAVNKAIEALEAAGKRDDAEVMRVAFSGLPPRKAIQGLLNTFNTKYFKPFATGGSVIPRPAFNVRNAISSAGQVVSDPETRGAALGQLARAPGDVWKGMSAWLRRLGMPLATPAHELDIAQAIKASRGDREAFIGALKDPVLKEAVRTGVLNSGFATSEGLVASAEQAAKGMGSLKNLRDAPQEWTRATEDSMRLGLFTDLYKGGKAMSAEKAAELVKRNLYDYAYSSVTNRALRDVIPFFQFTAKAVPQQAKFLMEKGVVPSVARNVVESLYDQGNEAVLPPQLQDSAAIPLGRDKEGNPTYLTSMGMPWEALSQIPNLTGDINDIGPEIRHNLIASSSPPLKALYSIASGSDPYFDTPFGSYDRAPYAAQALGADPNSETARYYNLLASSGLIQPLSSPVNVISGALDPRRSAGEAALNTLTGVRIKSVDEEQATRQLLEEALKRNPRVKRYTSLYQTTPDEDTKALLESLKAVKKSLSDKRKAEQAAAALNPSAEY